MARALVCAIAVATAMACASQPTFGDWQMTPRGQVSWTRVGQAIQLQTLEGQSGLYFRRGLDRDKTYRVSITGRNLSGQTTVRVVAGRPTPRWLPAPDGTRTFALSGRDSLELFLSSNTSATYRIDALAVDECTDCFAVADMPRRGFQDWQVEPYGDVALSPVAKGVRLDGLDPAGLTFERALDPRKTYRITIEGHPIVGQATGRLRIDGGAPAWFGAPDSRLSITVSERRLVEVMLYDDHPFTYALQALTVEECPTCLTDSKLKALILAQIPALSANLGRDRLAAARDLLGWTSHVVDFAGPDIDTSPEVAAASAAQAYEDLWLKDEEGATFCAGFAMYFVKILSLFGFNAFTADFGYVGTTATHVTTIVAMGNGGGQDFYVFDPTFNGVYVDQAGAFIPLDRLLSAPDPPRTFALRTGPLTRDLLFAAKDRGQLSNLLAAEGVDFTACTELETAKHEARLSCKDVPFDDRFIRVFWKDVMQQLKIPVEQDLLLRLMRHRVFSISAAERPVREQFLAMLARHQIPFGTE